jgi:hypothetical protein
MEKPVKIGSVEVDGESINIFKTKYQENERLAILLVTAIGEPFMKLSTNLFPHDMRSGSSLLAHNEFFVRLDGWSEHVHPLLLATGLFEDTQRRVTYGYDVPGAVWRLTK